MVHQIMWEEWPESYHLFPAYDRARRLYGFSLTLDRRLWTELTKRKSRFHQETADEIKGSYDCPFFALPATQAVGMSFGFERGIVIESLGEDSVTLRFSLQKGKYRGFATSMNLYWIVDSINSFELSSWSKEKGPPILENNKRTQIFALEIGGSLKPCLHGFPLTVFVSKRCADWLSLLPLHTDFPEARQHSAKVWRFYGARHAKPDAMQAHTREKGILLISALGNCNCLGQNPDSRIEEHEGYAMTSHNTDNPVEQLTLLIAVAQVWKDVRERMWTA